MAEVFEAVASGEGGFERRVAIKRMLPELHEDEAISELFLDEARTASALHHANLVAVVDYGFADGVPFQVLEYVDGIDAERLYLKGRDRHQPMPTTVALYLCLQVAHALDYVHTARGADDKPLGVVHRDISPSNVLVAWSGDVKLADFGIAWARHRTSQTAAGITRGKPAFMAPEQSVKGPIDGRTDLFSLGCTLHAFVAGNSPLSQPDALVNLLTGQPLSLAPTLPDDVRDIIAKAVRGAKHERYARASEMAEALGDALASRGTADARADLRRWLEGLEPDPKAKKPAKASALDAMLAIDLVPVDSGDGRQFSTAPARPAAASRIAPAPRAMRPSLKEPIEPVKALAETLPEVVAAAAPPPAPAAAPKTVRSAWIVAGVAALVTSVGLLRFAMRPGPETTASASAQPSTSAAPTAMSASALPRDPAPTATSVVASAVASVEPSAVPSASATASSVASARHHPSASASARPSARSTAPPSSSATTAPTAAATARPSETSGAPGMVAIGGEGATRAEIFVDGSTRGYAPRVIALPAGAHSLELVRPDGSRLGPQRIEVTAQHTASSPLRVRFASGP